jgi:hypothetical protein
MGDGEQRVGGIVAGQYATVGECLEKVIDLPYLGKLDVKLSSVT